MGKTKQADFPDALIVNKAKRHGQLNKNEVSTVYKFDKAALEIDGTKQQPVKAFHANKHYPFLF